MSTGIRVLFTVIYVVVIGGMLVPTIWTLLPHDATKANRLGYESLCSFAPWSTLSMVGITLLLTGIVYIIQYAVTR